MDDENDQVAHQKHFVASAEGIASLIDRPDRASNGNSHPTRQSRHTLGYNWGMGTPTSFTSARACAPSASAKAECRIRLSAERAISEAAGVEIDFDGFRERELARATAPPPPSPFDVAIERWFNENA